MRISQRGLDLIKEFEGFRSEAYRDIVGVLTVGYGFTKGVREGDTMTREQANARLLVELRDYENAVNIACTVEPTQNEFDSLCSMAWNIGIAGMRKSSVIKAHNANDKAAAARAFALWNKAGGRVIPGLVRRRALEAALYLEPSTTSALGMPQSIDPPKTMAQSSINQASVIGGGTAAIAAATEIAKVVGDFKGSVESLGAWWPVPALLIVTVVACGWLIWKRYQLRQEGRL